MSDLHPPVDDRDHVLGEASAPVTVAHYGDYECPLSHEVYRLIGLLQEAMGDALRYVYRHFPLKKVHPNAERAALAAEAAAAQGRFWEMHDLLFQNQRHLADRDLEGYAELLGLDLDRFAADMAAPAAAERIREDLRNGVASEVDTTLNLFINGRRYDGDMKIGQIAAAIEHLSR